MKAPEVINQMFSAMLTAQPGIGILTKATPEELSNQFAGGIITLIKFASGAEDMMKGLSPDSTPGKAWLEARGLGACNEPNMPVVAVIHAPEWAFPQPQQERFLRGLEATGFWSAYSDDLEAIAETLTADMGGFYGWRVDICLELIGKCAKSDRYTGTLTASFVG